MAPAAILPASIRIPENWNTFWADKATLKLPPGHGVSHGSCTALHCPTVIPKIKNIWTLPKKTAHYFISNIALTGYIPLCDFRQPASAAYTDTSAGLCAACGLLEIAEHVDECEKNLYRT